MSGKTEINMLVMIIAVVFGCGRSATKPAEKTISGQQQVAGETSSLPNTPFSAGSNRGDGKLFTQLGAEHTGMDFTIRWDKPEEYDRVFYSQNTGGGVCLADVDADGLPDVYLTRPSGGNRLYRNLGDLRFEDVTAKAGLRDDSFWGTGASFVDIDNDGDLDLYACQYLGQNRLYLNQGDGTFRLTDDAYGLNFSGASVMMAFADYDRDGDLDAYLVTAGLPPAPHQKFQVRFEGNKPVVLDELREFWDLLYLPGDKAKQIETGQFDRLYRNDRDADGKPHFVNVADDAGIEGTDIGQSATWFDFNRDGLPDLYVANDYWGPDRLYKNNGNGTFTDIAKIALPHTPWSSMGADFGDVNQDGLLDFLATDMAGSNHFRQKVGMGDMASAGWFLEYAQPRQYSRNALYINTGTERFMEAAFLTGLDSTDWTWTPRFEDFDNDGLVDVLITNGMTRDFTNSDLNNLAKRTAKEGSPEFFRFWRDQDLRKDANLIFRNLGQLRFEDASTNWGFDRLGVSFGAATADLDLDGDLDIVVNNMDTTALVYRNNSTGNNVLRLRLVGNQSNRSGLGAMVQIRYGETTQVRYQTMSRGWTSTSEPVLHFGLGDTSVVDEVLVEWPSDTRQVIRQLAANRIYEITEQETDAAPASSTDMNAVAFRESDTIKRLDVVHQEAPHDDFQTQPLLPNKLSQLGPGMACADINNDGRDDFYVGGAAGMAGVFLLSGSDGYRRETPEVFDNHKICEDMGALFFDADSDGDQDLYVASGGVEYPHGHGLLRDRLYLNLQGEFKLADSSDVPSGCHSGSVVAAADYDRDGDLDLFVGSRVIPGEFPLAPTSQLLQNNGGRLVDVIAKKAPELVAAGMVTSACWSDVDADGWTDLMVTYDWGPVRCFQNQKGTLRDVTGIAGLAERLGWWNGIASGDIDNDGDMDFAVTNFGLNTKYHATVDQPVRIYYGDFDGSGEAHIVESEFEGAKLFPIRGKSCSTNAIPILANRFTTFADFGVAELNQIYTESRLAEAIRYEVNTLESGVLLNDGHGRFEFRPLPRIAQIAPAFGSSLVDVDGDGNLDLYLAQNFYGPQRETGHMDGGVSLLLKGDGEGNWLPVWPDKSGLVVGADAKSLIATDLNADGQTDFLIGVNNSRLRGFELTANAPVRRGLLLRLRGPRGNPTGIGARVRIATDRGRQLYREVTSTTGYLSQTSSNLPITLADPTREVKLEIIWPDGRETRETIKCDTAVPLIHHEVVYAD